MSDCQSIHCTLYPRIVTDSMTHCGPCLSWPLDLVTPFATQDGRARLAVETIVTSADMGAVTTAIDDEKSEPSSMIELMAAAKQEVVVEDRGDA